MDAVLNWVWQGCIVAVASFVMLRALDRASANVRYAVCWAALLLIVALPALPFLPSISAAPSVAGRNGAVVSLPDSWWTSALVMLTAWTTWVGVCTVRFVFATVALQRARGRSRAFPVQVESSLLHWNRVQSQGRHATLVVSESVTAAAVLPWGTPMIAVSPSLVRTLDAVELDRVLIHEWAHVQRRDDIVNLLQIVVRAIAGWHPAVWWLDRRLHVEREIACDEMTVAITGSPKSYAECLIKLASLRNTARTLQGAPAVLIASGLTARVKKIVSPQRSIAPVWSRSLAAAIVSTLCVMSVSVGGLELVATTALALPAVSSRVFAMRPERFASPPSSAQSLRTENKAPARPRLAPRSSQHATVQEASVPSPPGPAPKPNPPVASDAPNPAHSAPQPPGADAGESLASDTPAVVHHPQPVAAIIAPEPPQSPWGAAADGGVAIARSSKKAGVATAGFFTRLAKGVAGSY